MSRRLAAALGQEVRRLLVVEPGRMPLSDLGPTQGSLVVLTTASRNRTERRRLAASCAPGSRGPVAVVSAVAPDLPTARGSFDAIVYAGRLGGIDDPVGLCRTLRRLARPGGVVVVRTRVGDGMLGALASLGSRCVLRGRLPRAFEVAAAMLRAGLRPVRQARLDEPTVPTLITWGAVRARPWEETPQSSCEAQAAEAAAAQEG